MKRAFDIVFSVVLLLIIWPILLIATIGIKLTSRGPVIYKAVRVGRDGKTFTVFKFRTMKVDSGEIRVTTLKNDERIYPFGSFLRKSKIDELPQLFNILLNQMTVVGPRPEDKVIADDIYTGKYKAIYSVKPGLTSPASLFDYTHGEHYDTHERYTLEFLPLKLDIELYYVQHSNFFYDIRIVLATAMTVLKIVLGRREFEYPKEYYAVQQKNEAD